MSDRLRKAGLVKVKPVEAPKPPEAAVAPLARVTPTPPEPIAKPATKALPARSFSSNAYSLVFPALSDSTSVIFALTSTIDLGASYELNVTPNGDKFKVEISPKSGNTPIAVTPDAREIVDATIELAKGQSAQLYVSRAGSLDKLELDVAEDVSAKITEVESLKAGKTREYAFDENDIAGKAILLESGERLVYVKEHDALHIFDREGKVESLTASTTDGWVKEVGLYKVWYDPRDPEYLITVGHTEELAKVKEVEAREIKFSDTEVALGATKGMMKFKVADEEIRVHVTVDADGKLTAESKTNSRSGGMEVEENDGTIRITNIFGRRPSSHTQVNEVWNAQKGTHIEILGSTLTEFRIIWNKIKGIAHITTYAPGLDNLVCVLDSKLGTEVSNRSDRSNFSYKGKNYELNVTSNQVMLAQVQAPQPTPRPVGPAATVAGSPSARREEPKVVVDDGKKATAPPLKGAERVGSGARTQVIPAAKDPKDAIEADDEEEAGQPQPTGNRKVVGLIAGVALAFGLTYGVVRSYLKAPEQIAQTTPDSAVVIAPPPAPTIPAPPPVIASPPVVTPPAVAADSGVVTVRDATADTTPVRRRRSSGSSGGFGNFEGM